MTTEFRVYYKHDNPPLKFEQYYDEEAIEVMFRMEKDHAFRYPFWVPFYDDDWKIEQFTGNYDKKTGEKIFKEIERVNM